MDVLVACEFSGIVRNAFIRRGHFAMSCDLIATVNPGPHFKGDVREMLDHDWDLIIAHPPCTYLCNSGVQHLTTIGRKRSLSRACEFFNLFLSHPCKRICVENPIPHGHALKKLSSKYTQIVQPWMFGHPETKATCLWLKGLSKLVATDNVSQKMKGLPKSMIQRTIHVPPGPHRGRIRSITYKGIAEAMAEQWGSFS